MTVSIVKPIGLTMALLASTAMALATGCASGGFKLTRQYAHFVNRQMIIIRIILYIFTSIVFAATLIIDMVIFNTMDFWQGRVSAGEYNFNKGDKSFHVRHEVMPGAPLKRSTIEVFNQDKALLQTVVLQETTTGEIEFYIDGKLHTKVRDIESLPVAMTYDSKGTLVAEKLLTVEMGLPSVMSAAR